MNTLIIAKIIWEDLYPKFLDATITDDEIVSYFVALEPNPDCETCFLCYMWHWLSFNGNPPNVSQTVFDSRKFPDISKCFYEHGELPPPSEIPMWVHQEWLDVFSIYQQDGG